MLGLLFFVVADQAKLPALQQMIPNAAGEALLSIFVPVPSSLLDFFSEHLPAVVCFSLASAVPVLIIYVLGLRKYDFFPLSRIWNFVFCSWHGVVFYQLLRLLKDPIGEADPLRKTHLPICVVLIFLFFGTYALQLTCLARSNRIAAKGLQIPCLRQGKAVQYPFGSDREFKNFSHDVKQYFRAAARCALLCATSDFCLLFVLRLILTILR